MTFKVKKEMVAQKVSRGLVKIYLRKEDKKGIREINFP
jgi:hypothetical protein